MLPGACRMSQGRRERILDEAAQWMALLQSGHAGAEERLAFQQWRQADAEHGAVFDRLSLGLQSFRDEPLHGLRAEQLIGALEAPSARRRFLQRSLGLAAFGVATLALGRIGIVGFPGPATCIPAPDNARVSAWRMAANWCWTRAAGYAPNSMATGVACAYARAACWLTWHGIRRGRSSSTPGAARSRRREPASRSAMTVPARGWWCSSRGCGSPRPMDGNACWNVARARVSTPRRFSPEVLPKAARAPGWMAGWRSATVRWGGAGSVARLSPRHRQRRRRRGGAARQWHLPAGRQRRGAGIAGAEPADPDRLPRALLGQHRQPLRRAPGGEPGGATLQNGLVGRYLPSRVITAREPPSGSSTFLMSSLKLIALMMPSPNCSWTSAFRVLP